MILAPGRVALPFDFGADGVAVFPEFLRVADREIAYPGKPDLEDSGHPARPRCINVVALRRGGFSRESIAAVTEAHRLLYRAKVTLEPAREILRSQAMLLPDVVQLLDFLAMQQEGRHGRARERRRAA